jgi:predicted component of type VI protein secretion system
LTSVHKQEGEATISLQLLATVAEAGEDHLARHVSAVAAAVQGEISKHIPPHPEPWPQMVELGFVAVASLVQTWDGAEPDEDDGKALANW